MGDYSTACQKKRSSSGAWRTYNKDSILECNVSDSEGLEKRWQFCIPWIDVLKRNSEWVHLLVNYKVIP